MNEWIQKLEKRFGRYAVPHLTYVLVGCYVLGYFLQTTMPAAAQFMSLDIYGILHGQVWRLVTWVVVPPSSFDFFTIIMLLFYFSIGSSLERVWGDFYYNLYVFGGILLSIVLAFIGYALFCGLTAYPAASVGSWIGNRAFSTYYISMSLLLAYAATFPDATVLLMFLFPVPMKYLGVVYGILLAYEMVSYVRIAVMGGPQYWLNALAILASFLNFLLFFFVIRRGGFRIKPTREQKQRQKQFREAVNRKKFMKKTDGEHREGTVTKIRPYRHRCAVCGRTDVSDPDLDFRYCSKCSGAYEYCMDHLYTHVHVTGDEKQQNED